MPIYHKSKTTSVSITINWRIFSIYTVVLLLIKGGDNEREKLVRREGDDSKFYN